MNQTNPSKSYGNAFLGPSLWEKNEIFQNEKFGVEILDIDEFLNDNNLNEADIKFLDRLQSTDNIQQKQSKSVESVSPNQGNKVKVPIYNASSVTIKVKGNKFFSHLACDGKELFFPDFNEFLFVQSQTIQRSFIT